MDTVRYKNKYRISPARLKGYNYSNDGLYFVTICTRERICYFGDIVKNTNVAVETQNLASLQQAFWQPTEIGKIARQYWLEIPKHFPFVKLDKFVVMPNHLHGVLRINNDIHIETQNIRYQNKFGPQSKNLSSIIRGFKIGVTKYTNNHNIGFSWQSRFHDRIIRNEEELNKIRQYIVNNPLRWDLDRNNQDNLFM